MGTVERFRLRHLTRLHGGDNGATVPTVQRRGGEDFLTPSIHASSMPNRIIRESSLTSATLDSLTDGAERFFFRLTLVADDCGRFNADTRVLLAKCFPLRVTRMRLEQITRWWMELLECGAVKAYCSNERLYGYFPAWKTHQRVRNSVSKFPDPAICGELPQIAADCGSRARASGVGVGVGVGVENTTLSVSRPTLRGSSGASRREEAKTVLAFLNDKRAAAGLGQFRPVQTHLRLIEARLHDGASVEDCRSVIARKVRQWKDDPKSQVWLRPSTLFRPSNFENYLGELVPSVESLDA